MQKIEDDDPVLLIGEDNKMLSSPGDTDYRIGPRSCSKWRTIAA